MTLFGSPERRLVALVGSIAFLSGMVFSMVSALAPMFSRDLGVPAQSIGTIMGSYMLASAVSGFIGTLYLDRFDRRKGLAVGLTGVVLGLIMTALAPNLPLLIAARILSGIFAGPSSALSLAIIVDNIPAERRGRALGSVSAFQALSQVFGIPIGLAIAEGFGSWRAPFFATALVGALLAFFVIYHLPAQRTHLIGASFAVRQRLRLLGQLLSRPICLIAYSVQMTGIVPLVAITTIMSLFLVNNLGYPQGGLNLLYFIGGLANFLAAWLVIGKAVDRFGAGIVSVVSTVMLSAAVGIGYLGLGWPVVVRIEGAMRGALQGPFWDFARRFGLFPELLPVILVFALFFVASSARLVVGQTMSARIPRPEERAGFQALGQSIQSVTMAFSALAIPKLLGSTADGALTGVDRFAYIVIAVTCVFPFLVYWLDALLNRRETAAAAADAIAAPAE